MKKILMIINLGIMVVCASLSFAQQPFYVTRESPGFDAIFDLALINDTYYVLQNRVQSSHEWDADVFSDLLILNSSGGLIDEINLDGFRSSYQRIYDASEDKICLIGSLKNDTCSSILVFSEFNLLTYQLSHLKTIMLCDRILTNINVVDGLNDQMFLDEYHYLDDRFIKSIYKIDSNYNLTLVWDNLWIGETISIDFARTGYVKASIGLYDFYDRDFNHRKQRYTNEYFKPIHETHIPFGKNYILEQGVQHVYAYPEYGLQVRLIDSNLHVQRKIVMVPNSIYYGNIDMPFFGGIDIQGENEIWSANTFGHLDVNFELPSYNNITKLDSNLNVICQHFLGYDTRYRLYGIRAFESGGAMIFGNRLKEGEGANGGEDIFALRVGENCELPTVSTTDPHSLISISAYPNPAINSLTFDVRGFDPSSLAVEFFDAKGSILFSKKDLSYEIHVTDLPPGQYFYRITQGETQLGVGAWVKQ